MIAKFSSPGALSSTGMKTFDGEVYLTNFYTFLRRGVLSKKF